MANGVELEIRRREEVQQWFRPLAVLGRYVRRSRRYRRQTQRELASASGLSQTMVSRLERGEAPAMRLDGFVDLWMALGRLFPLGACPHDHDCAWQPVKPFTPPADDGHQLLANLLRDAGETSDRLDPDTAAHDTMDIEFGVELDEIGALAGGEAAAVVDAE
jgi:DNA-binding XRE family transcriptional regulator